MEDNTTELRTRVVTATVLVGVVIAVALLAAYLPVFRWGFVALGFIISGLSAWEFAWFASGEGSKKLRCALYFVGLVLGPIACMYAFSSSILGNDQLQTWHGLLIPLLGSYAAGAFGVVAILSEGRTSLEEAAVVAREYFLAAALIGFGGSMLMTLGMLPGSSRFVLWLIAVVAANDTAAYFGGKAIGGMRLAPLISPNKTVSGSACGLGAGIIVGTLLGWLLPLSIGSVIGLSYCVSVMSQLGDLTKSFLKRLHGTKDSGTLLPGHGGVLDRVDGLLFSAPVLVLWLVTVISLEL